MSDIDTFNGDGTSPIPSTEVVRVVAALADVPPEELPLLTDVIDPDALNRLFAGKDNTTGKVVFQYYGYPIAVDDEGNVSLDRS